MYAKGALERDAMLYLAARAVPAATTLLLVTVLVRTLGTEGFGHFSLAQNLVLIGGNFASAWLGQALLRYGPAMALDDSRQTLKAAIALGVLLSYGVAVPAVVAFSLLVLKQSVAISMVIAFALLVFILYAVALNWKTSRLRSKRVLGAEAMRAMTFLLLAGIVVVSGRHSLMLLLLAFASSFVVGGVILGVPRPASFGGNSQTWRSLGRAARYGLPMAGWMFTSSLLNMGDRYVINYFWGAKYVGEYAAMSDIVLRAVTFLLAPIITAAHPLIMNAWNAQDGMATQQVTSRAVKLLLLAAGVFLIVVLPLHRYLPRIILGHDSSLATAVIVPIALGAVLMQLCVLLHKPLEYRDRTVQLFGYLAASVVIQFALDVFLVPRVGPQAAAYAFLMGVCVYFVLVVKGVRASRPG